MSIDYIKDLLLILAPLFIGSLIPIKQKVIHKIIEKGMSFLVFFIIFVMGIGLGQMPNLFKEIGNIFMSVLCFVIVLHACNLIFLWHYGKKNIGLIKDANKNEQSSMWSMLWFSAQLILTLVIGFIIGYLTKNSIHFDHQVSNYLLMILLFLVGIQLRNSGIPMRHILLNKHGTITAILFITSCFVGGIICALILGLPINQGLALASGFGWYSLSGLVLQDAFGPVLGSIAFLNDISREFIAFLFIPVIMRSSPCTSIGIGGATSLDFTLPIIQRSGGLSVVPVAISFGFIVNLLAPVFLVLFSKLS